MTLFGDKDLFSSGTRGKKIYDLPDADVMLHDNFFDKDESDHYYETFLNQTPWQEYRMEIYDKVVTAPRMIAWYETDPVKPETLTFTRELHEIRKRVEAATGHKFNAVLLNLYRDGNDGVAWHSDRTDRSGKDPVIASVTFGQTRMFRLRHKTRKGLPVEEIPLFHGSLLVMAGTTNSYWEHGVPKTKRDVSGRVNLTFRQVK